MGSLRFGKVKKGSSSSNTWTGLTLMTVVEFFFCGTAAQIGPRHPHLWSFLIRQTHTRQDCSKRVITWSKKSQHYLRNTQRTQQIIFHALSVIRTCDWHKRPQTYALASHGHRDRPFIYCISVTLDIVFSLFYVAYVLVCCSSVIKYLVFYWKIYKVVQIWPGLIVCKLVTVCPGHIWTTLYFLLLRKWATGIEFWTLQILVRFCHLFRTRLQTPVVELTLYDVTAR